MCCQSDDGCTLFYNSIPWPGFRQYHLDSSSLPGFHHLLFLIVRVTVGYVLLTETYSVYIYSVLVWCHGFLGGLCSPFKVARHWFSMCLVLPSLWKQLYKIFCASGGQVCENNSDNVTIMSSGSSQSARLKMSNLYSRGRLEFERHGLSRGRKGLRKDAITLHHGKRRIQWFWNLTYSKN